MKIHETLEKQPKFVVSILVVIGLAIVGLIDYTTGSEISFSIFYLIPISLCLWYLGKWEAILVSFISAVMWFIGENKKAYSHEEIAYWNAAVRMGFFVVVVLLLDYVKRFNISLEGIIKERTEELVIEIAERKKAQEEVIVKNEQLSSLAMKIQNVKEEENIRVAREIHDELGQVLTALKMEISMLGNRISKDIKSDEKFLSVNNLIDETINSVRKISTRLRPRLLDDLGLFPAMEMQIREFQTRTGVRCIFDLPEKEVISDKELSLAIFRIFQEALTNIARHADATHVQIKSYVDSTNYFMEIKDNGVGLKNNSSLKTTTLGILGMKERANLLNGEVTVESLPERGTFIKVCLPLTN